ncbi:hypothetical protein GCM10009548_95650 [Streptomyces malaysiensis subsp. malaysiensis]
MQASNYASLTNQVDLCKLTLARYPTDAINPYLFYDYYMP